MAVVWTPSRRANAAGSGAAKAAGGCAAEEVVGYRWTRSERCASLGEVMGMDRRRWQL